MAHATTQVVTPLLRAIERDTDVVRVELPHAMAGESRAVHRVRVASRRLRAAVPIAAGITRESAGDLARDVRRITRALGRLRESDVALEWIDTAAPRSEHGDAMARVRAACAAERDRSRRALRSRIKRRAAAGVIDDAGAVAERLARAPGGRASTVLAAAVGRRARQMSEALREAGTTYGVESLHRLRLATKKLRYTLELAQSLFGAFGRRVLRDLRGLQKRLGQIHDGQAVRRYVRIAAAESGVTREMVGHLAEIDRELDTTCRRLHARLVASRADLQYTLEEIRDLVATYASPRRVGRMARMPVDRPRRRTAVGA